MVLRALVFFALVVATVIACVVSPAPVADEKIGVEMNLPLFSGEWAGSPIGVSQKELEVLPPDTEYERAVYRNIAGRELTCSIVLAGADRRSIHRPEVCLPAQGWNVKSSGIVVVPVGGGREIPAKRLLLSRQIESGDGSKVEMKAYSYYWFVGNDVVTADQTKRVLLTAWDNIVRNVNHRWAYITVQSWITEGMEPGGTTPEEAKAVIESFIKDVVPEFQLVFPEG